MTPCRTEKACFSKKKQKPNHQKNNSTGRVTIKIKKTNAIKTKKKQKLKKQNLHFPQLFFLLSACFFCCFFLGFGFLDCFVGSLWFCCFYIYIYIFVKPYILCVAGLISLVVQIDSFKQLNLAKQRDSLDG